MTGSDLRPLIGILALLLMAAGCWRPSGEAHSAGAESSSTASVDPTASAPAVIGSTESAESTGLAGSAGATDSDSAGSADANAPNAIFAPVLPRLRETVRIPLRLPAVLGWEDTPPDSAFAIVERADSAGYTLMIALASRCDGGNWCRYGNVSGARARAGAPRPAGTPVPLADGITGHFVDATCGAVCSDSELWWEENGVRYAVGVKAADGETLAAIARSALGSR